MDFNANLNPDPSDYASGDTGSGSVLDSILRSATTLGSVALLSYGPQNSALAVNPQGQVSRVPYQTPMGASPLLTWILIGGVAIFGFWAFGRMRS